MRIATSLGASALLFAATSALAQSDPAAPAAPATVPAQPAITAQPAAPLTPAPPAPASTPDWTTRLSEIFATTEPQIVASGLEFAEGPLWWNNRLLVCDLGDDTMYTVVPQDGAEAELVEFRKPSDRAAGAALDIDGNLIAAHFAGHLTRTATDGTVQIIADRRGDAKFGKCNDLVCHPSGVIFFTDFGGKNSKGVFALAKDGVVSQVADDYYAANGVALSPDHRRLYAADYGNWNIKGYDVDADGNATNGRDIISLKGETGKGRVDGLKVAPSGHILSTGPGGIWVITPEGEKHSRLAIADGASNLAFGGPDGKTVFITSGKTVLSVKLK